MLVNTCVMMVIAVLVPPDRSMAFTITTRKPEDTVEVQADKDRVLFDIRSPAGISRAVIERNRDYWPKVVTIRLRLNGLESFRVSNGTIDLAMAVSSTDDPATIRRWKGDREENLLNEKDPLRSEVRIIGKDGKPARKIPVEEGYFEITLPPAFLSGNPKTITLSWIDFYRN